MIGFCAFDVVEGKTSIKLNKTSNQKLWSNAVVILEPIQKKKVHAVTRTQNVSSRIT